MKEDVDQLLLGESNKFGDVLEKKD